MLSYKLQKFSTVYPESVRQFLINNADYDSLSYAELYERFIRCHYGWADYYAKNLRALGVEVRIDIRRHRTFAESMGQRAWS